MTLTWLRLPSRDLITRPMVDERLAQAFSLTLGDVAAELEGMLPPELSRDVRQGRDIRNFLAHHFWFNRLADGSLWQLSDIGLGWTPFQRVGPTWTEHPALKRHLPADILPRPNPTAPWDYEFALAKGVVLWVKPGRRKETFRWGVRKPKTSAEQGA